MRTARYALRCAETWDAADLEAGPHQGTFASACKDGHGRALRSTERIRDDNGKLELRHILTDFLPSGEAFRITRQRNDEGATQVTRWMRFDSLGRMLLNVEPNTSAGFVADPILNGPVPASLKAWRYAYNFGGDLVGTSDARGCGANYHYDAAGRLVAEDYSPCRADHEPYTSPDLLTGTGTEVFTRYDLLDPEAASVGQGFTGSPALLLGRVASVSDRGAKVMNQVDCRGRVQAIAKKVAKPPSVTAGLMTDTTPLSARYAPRWYVKKALYDGADRNVLSTTGATSPELQRASIQGETSAVTTTFSKRGLVVSVAGSYGPLVTGVVKGADGLTQKVTYGDLAKTETVFTYDQRRRVRTVQTYRGPPSCWTLGEGEDNPPPECQGYAPAGLYGSPEPTTFPLLLEDTEFAYDSVDNPVELRDWRLPHEWPAGAKPVSKKAEYDDLYRLKRLDYVYPAGKDDWTSPFAHEDALALQVPDSAAKPTVDALPRQSFDERLLWQTYRYDWLGNSVSSDDDAHGFYDRSLGGIKNGTPTAGPYQLKEASNETAGKKPREGKLTAKYDEAGYLTDLAVNRSATGLCLPANKPCNHRFRYDWDEVGRLSVARRWDTSTAVNANDALPTEAAAITLRHSYDGGDMRVVKEATSCTPNVVAGGCTPQTLHSVYVFDSLDLRRAYFTAATGEPNYETTSETEAAYLVANGVRLARLHHEPTLPAVGGDGLHVFLELADHLGSGSIVLDKATSELAERMTYQGYGSVESDYRPGRWGAFREDYRFTGKEEDSEVGLTYFGFRYLNTALGRWASADPLTVHQLGADLNVYAYVHGRALRAVDPLGLDAGTPQPWENGSTLEDLESNVSTAPLSFEKGEVHAGIEKMSGKLKEQNAPSRVIDYFLVSGAKSSYTTGDTIPHFLSGSNEVKLQKEGLSMWIDPEVGQILGDSEEFNLLRPDGPPHEIGHQYVEDYAKKFPGKWANLVDSYTPSVEKSLQGIVPPKELESKLANFSDRYTDEAIATRYGLRLTAFMNLKQELGRLQGLSENDAQKSAQISIESFNNLSKKLNDVGYVVIGESQVHLKIPMPKNVKDFVDGHMLEGKMPSEF